MDKKCTIYSVQMGIEDGEQREIVNTLYDNIPCDFYPVQSKGRYKQNEQATQYPDVSFEVVLPGKYSDVIAGYHISLSDMGLIGIFLILPNPIAYRHINGSIDNIVLQVSKLDD